MSITNYGVTFNGRKIVHPGAYDYIDDTSMVVTSASSLNLPVIIGESDGGQPGVVKWFSNASLAKAYLKGGDLYNSIDLVFSPLPEGGGGASIIGVITTSANVQATATIGGIPLTAIEYGVGGNAIQASVMSGTIPGTKKVVLTKWTDGSSESYDSLGALINLQYTGASAYAGVTVTLAQPLGSAIRFQTNVGASAGTATIDLDLDLTSGRFPTIGSLCQYINSVSGYSCSAFNGEVSNILIEELDEIDSTQINTSIVLYGVAGHIIYEINNSSALVTASVPTVAVVNAGYTYLTGGVKGASPVSWSSYWLALQNQFFDVLVVLTSSSLIQIEALTFVQQMELRKQKQVLFTGGALGETITDIKQRAATLNSSRAVVVYPGVVFTSTDSNGTISTVSYPSYLASALIAGRVCGVSPSTPITFSYVNVSGLEKDLLVGDPNIDDLITSGVCTLERTYNGGIRIVQGITTYLTSNNTLDRELSVRRGADDLSSTVTSTLEDNFAGKKGLNTSVLAIKNKTISVLENAVANEEILSYQNITVSISGTIVNVEYEVAPVEPMNFILVTSHYVSAS